MSIKSTSPRSPQHCRPTMLQSKMRRSHICSSNQEEVLVFRIVTRVYRISHDVVEIIMNDDMPPMETVRSRR